MKIAEIETARTPTTRDTHGHHDDRRAPSFAVAVVVPIVG
jgi:hypothetical protein